MEKNASVQALVIEPEAEASADLAARLTTLGLEVRTVYSHLKGLAELDDGPAEIAVVSMDGTDIDGLEFARLLRRREAESEEQFTYILLLGENRHRAEITEKGAMVDAFLIRPFLASELSWQIGAALKTIRMLRGLRERLKECPEDTVLNRDTFRQVLLEEVSRAVRKSQGLSLALISITGLESVELDYGLTWSSWLEGHLTNEILQKLRNHENLVRMDRGFLCLLLAGGTIDDLKGLVDRVDIETSRHLRTHSSHLFSGIGFDIRGVNLELAIDHEDQTVCTEVLLEWLQGRPLEDLPTDATLVRGRLKAGGVEFARQSGH
jgi:DNA-binding response OmpR family regulator